MGLSSKFRIKKSSDYQNLFDGSEVLRFGICTVFRKPNGLSHFRLGMTVKAKGSSVVRNAIRRQIRETISKFDGDLLGPFDYNFVVKIDPRDWPRKKETLKETLNIKFPKRIESK